VIGRRPVFERTTPECSSGEKNFDLVVDGGEEVTQTTLCAFSVGCSLLDPPFPGGSFFISRSPFLRIAATLNSVKRHARVIPAKHDCRRR
jgi:hypothetical protein